MIFIHQSRSVNGLHQFLGRNPRPFDPRELWYHFNKAVAPTVVDLSQVRSLGSIKLPQEDSLVDARPEIEDQGPLGACTCYSGIACARCCARAAQRFLTVPPMLAGDRLYEIVRKAENSWPQDAGSALADADDILVNKGDALESQDPEHHQADFDYQDIATLDTSGQIWIAAHHPFYSTDPVLNNIWTALDAGMPIHIGQYWANAWFNPDQFGVVDPTVTQAMAVGGHATYIHTIFPNAALGQGVPPLSGGGGVAVGNQWTPDWNIAVVKSGAPYVRPGDYIIPWAALANGRVSVVDEYRAISLKPYAKPVPVPVASPSQPWVDWLWNNGLQMRSYMNGAAEDARAAEAQVIVDTTRRFFPGITLSTSMHDHQKPLWAASFLAEGAKLLEESFKKDAEKLLEATTGGEGETTAGREPEALALPQNPAMAGEGAASA